MRRILKGLFSFSRTVLSLILWRSERKRVLHGNDSLRRALCISADELWGLYGAFQSCNLSATGMVTLEELLAYLDLDRSFLTERVYNIYRDGGAGISFKAFVLATWNLCSRDRDGLAFFAFNVYDIYGRGWLGLLEVTNLLREVYGSDYDEKHTARSTMRKLCHVDVKGRPVGARVTFKKFLEVSRTAGVLMFPAFELQHVLQERTGGTALWEELTARRNEGVATGRLDITVITRIANENKPRRRTVVAVSENHFLPVMAALADGGASALPEGMRGVAAARQRRASKLAPMVEVGSAEHYLPPPPGSATGGSGSSGESGLPKGALVDPTTGEMHMPEIDVDGEDDLQEIAAVEADDAATRQRLDARASKRRLGQSTRRLDTTGPGGTGTHGVSAWGPQLAEHAAAGIADYAAHESRTNSRVSEHQVDGSAEHIGIDSDNDAGDHGSGSDNQSVASGARSRASSVVSTSHMMEGLTTAMRRKSHADAEMKEAAERAERAVAGKKGGNASAAAMRAAAVRARGRL